MQISEDSRVWIYQADRAFTGAEKEQIEDALKDFTSQWQAHGFQLSADAEVRYNRFIILMVDEAQAGATGCSIDKSVRMIKDFEQQFNVNLFDRLNIAFRRGDDILSLDRDRFEQEIQSGRVTEDTIVFNNLVQTKKELDTNWETQFRNSWHARVYESILAAGN
ncbi:ABC transporter ATPase [Desertivirga xinjiangensis]|uniref:ABC transporter ATPase n=1 Tax=Desertivirga xinjiangensis TaxID=539206 RepID=UPI00210D39D7|nr:ABC transporter ATPase [Pedobacter xinjiangensis]